MTRTRSRVGAVFFSCLRSVEDSGPCTFGAGEGQDFDCSFPDGSIYFDLLAFRQLVPLRMAENRHAVPSKPEALIAVGEYDFDSLTCGLGIRNLSRLIFIWACRVIADQDCHTPRIDHATTSATLTRRSKLGLSRCSPCLSGAPRHAWGASRCAASSRSMPTTSQASPVDGSRCAVVRLHARTGQTRDRIGGESSRYDHVTFAHARTAGDCENVVGPGSDMTSRRS